MRKRPGVTIMLRGTGISIAMAGMVAFMGPAEAHHVMDGAMPTNFLQGLLSGLGHPLIGIDHFAAVAAVGCLAAFHAAAVPLALSYVMAMIVGAAIHVQGMDLPGGELGVGLSLLGLGLAMWWRAAIVTPGMLALVAVVGVIHGYALGESIVGAEPAPLIAYFAGFALVQAAIALASVALTRFFSAHALPARAAATPTGVRLIGVVVFGVGIVALARNYLAA
ncbi:MAG: HupE/UreJ family protein [Proteobacteria bacterium]|nr:HupE/UreJ family protein [Pseudomonadota bacterium]